MQPTDKAECLKLVSDVHAYYGKSVSDFTLSVWWEAMQSFDIEQVRRALTTHAMDPDHGKFAPKVADVVRVLRGTTVDRAVVAWGAVMQAIGSVGAYQDVDFGDPATHAAVHDLGGWPKVCRTPEKEFGYVQHRFCEAYRGYSNQGVTECPLTLMGDRSPDTEWERKGLPAPRAMLVGPRPCAEVMQSRSLGPAAQIAAEAIRRLPPPQPGAPA